MTGVLESLILFSVTPIGFFILISMVIFFEYLIVKSIMKDKNSIIHPVMIFNYIKNRQSSSLTSSEWTVLDVIFKMGRADVREISSNIGITVYTARKLVSNLQNRGYINRIVNINDRRTFSFVTSDKYRKQRMRSYFLRNIRV